MSEKPTFSIIIPSYKRANTLKLLLEDLKNQKNIDLKKIEVVVVNEEDSPEYRSILEYFSRFLEIKLVDKISKKIQHPIGSSIARNIGMDYARGEFLIFLDDDVRVDKHFISKCMELSKIYDAFSFRIAQPDDPRPWIVKAIQRRFVGKIYITLGIIFGGFELEKYSKARIEVDHFPGTAFVVRRTIVENIKFDEYLGIGNGYLEDSDFTYSIRKSGNTLTFITDYSIQHKRAPEGGNRMVSPSEWVNEKWLYFYWNHKAYFIKKHGDFLSLVVATLFNFLESIFISTITRRFFVYVFIKGWFDGIRVKHRI